MPRQQYLEAGVIANTHGINGAVRVKPWSDDSEFLCDFDRIYIDGEERIIEEASVHKTQVILYIEGVEDINAAIALKGKTIFINRDDVEMEEGRYFIQDLIGLTVNDKVHGTLGEIEDVLNLPANDVYVVKGEKSYMIPAVPEFVKKVDIDSGIVETEIIEGMES